MKPTFYKKLYLSIVALCLSIPALECASVAPRAYSSAQRAAQRTLPQAQQSLYRGMATTPRVRQMSTMPRLSTTVALPSAGETRTTTWQPGEEWQQYLRRKKAEDEARFPEEEKKLIFQQEFLTKAFEVVNEYRDTKSLSADALARAQVFVSDAVKQQKLLDGLIKELRKAPRNTILAELVDAARTDVLLANTESKVLTSYFDKRAASGDEKAREISNVLKKAAEEAAKEEVKGPIATSWNEQLAQWIASLTKSESSILQEEERQRLSKLFQQDVLEAVQNIRKARAIQLDAAKQKKFAMTLIQESEGNPDNAQLAKLAEMAKKNAFAAEFKFQQLKNLLEQKVAEGNQTALTVLSVLKEEEPKIFFGPEERRKPLFRSKEDEELYKKLKSQYFSPEGKAAIKKTAAAVGALATTIGAAVALNTEETEQAAKAKQPAQAQESWYDRIKNYFWGKPQVQQPQAQQPQAKPNK